MPELLGKNILLTSDDPPTSYEQLHTLLARLNVRDTLRQFGELSARFDLGQEHAIVLQGTLVPLFALPVLALELILSSDDTPSASLDDHTLVELIRCYHALPWSDPTGDGAKEMLLRMAQSQFSFQDNDQYRFFRWMRVFHELWSAVPKASGIDVNIALTELLGVNADELMVVTLYLTTRAANGIVSVQPIEGELDHPAIHLLQSKLHDGVLRRLSTTYDELRQKCASPVSDELRKTRYNPLVLTPLVIPDVQPAGAPGDVLVVPCRKFLIDRLTYGVVFDLKERYGKPFDDAFGHVVEAYVGDILSGCYGRQVIGEFDYRRDGKSYRSPDWTVFGTDCAVVVEVKHRLLYAQAKTSGDLSRVREDLSRTLKKACHQLLRFRSHIPTLSRPYPEPHNVELVVVAWDDISWSAILRELLEDAPDGTHVHVVSVQDFEALLRRCPGPDDLVRQLWIKRNATQEQADMDMHDWIAHYSPDGNLPQLKTLDSAWRAFAARWNLGLPERV